MTEPADVSTPCPALAPVKLRLAVAAPPAPPRVRPPKAPEVLVPPRLAEPPPIELPAVEPNPPVEVPPPPELRFCAVEMPAIVATANRALARAKSLRPMIALPVGTLHTLSP